MSWQQVCFDYDGSYPGFLTCVFESYAHREEAVCFTSPEEDRLTLWPERHVDTDQAKAERVYRSLSKKISPQACRLVTQAFLTCLPERELHMYRFLRLGYQRGGGHHPGSHRRPGPRAVEGGAAPGERGPSAQGVPPLLRSAGGAGRGDRAQKPGASPPPPPLLHPVLRGALPHLRPHPPGVADPSAQSVGHSARGRLCPCPAGAGGGDLPASVEAVL